jgi:O-succinylbenzoic acid--CoA ligase
VQVVTAHSGQPVQQLVGAVADALSSGPALTVLPDAPPAWQRTIRDAVHADRQVRGPGLVVPTSGSTGAPVGVVLGAPALRWSAAAVDERLGGPGAWVLALPVTHVAGIMVLVRAVAGGTAVVQLADDWHRALSELPPGRRYTALVPTQVRRLLADDPSVLARFDAVLVGGAGLDPHLRIAAEQVGARLVESYGMTETCGGCVHDGVPLPGASVRLGRAGHVSIAGPMLGEAYRHADGDDALAADGWFTTNDVAQWHEGRLRVLGRTDDVVVTGGVSVSLAQVDDLLAGHPDLADVVAVGLPDEEWGTRVVAVAVPAPGAHPTWQSVRSYVAERAEPGYVPRDLLLVDDLHRPGPGKVDRAALARRLGGT